MTVDEKLKKFGFTSRERELIHLWLDRTPQKDMSDKLFICLNAVSARKRTIIKKLKINSTAGVKCSDLVIYKLKNIVKNCEAL